MSSSTLNHSLAVSDSVASQESCESADDRYILDIPVTCCQDKDIIDGLIRIEHPFQGIGMTYSVADNGCFVRSLIHAETAKGWGMVLWEDLLGKHPLQLKERFHQLKEEGLLPEGASFRLVNFNPFLVSDRVNPIQCRYIRSLDDAIQVAASFLGIVFNTFHIEGDLNRYRPDCENLLAAAIYFLVNYGRQPYDADGELLSDLSCHISEDETIADDDAVEYYNHRLEKVPVHHWTGRCSSLPHVFSLLMLPDSRLLGLLGTDPKVSGLVARLTSAFAAREMNVIDRVLGTLRTVISRFMTPKYYWVLSGDDFDLNVSSEERPVYLSMSVGTAYRSSENAISCFVLDRVLAETARRRDGDRPSSIILADYPVNMAGRLKHWLSLGKRSQMSYAVGLRSSDELSADVGNYTANYLFRQFGVLASSPATSIQTIDFLREHYKGVVDSKEQQIVDLAYPNEYLLGMSEDFIGGVALSGDAVSKPFLGCLESVWEEPASPRGEVWRHTALDIFREEPKEMEPRYMECFQRINRDIEELCESVLHVQLRKTEERG